MSDTDGERQPRYPRWASRQKAMAYGDFGSTRMNELLQGRKLKAKKDGAKVKIDLNSIDDYIDALPDVGPENALTSTST